MTSSSFLDEERIGLSPDVVACVSGISRPGPEHSSVPSRAGSGSDLRQSTQELLVVDRRGLRADQKGY